MVAIFLLSLFFRLLGFGGKLQTKKIGFIYMQNCVFMSELETKNVNIMMCSETYLFTNIFIHIPGLLLCFCSV